MNLFLLYIALAKQKEIKLYIIKSIYFPLIQMTIKLTAQAE